MTKTMVAAILALVVTGSDYAKMLGEAKYSLGEAVEKGLKEVKGGTIVKCEIEEEKGRTIYTMDIAQGDKIVEINFSVVDGSIVAREDEDEDQSSLVKAAKCSVSQAIEAALKKAGGKAVSAELKKKGDAVEVHVGIWVDGKLMAVTVNDKGVVTGCETVKEKQKTPHGMNGDSQKKRPGFIGINGQDVDGGVKITTLVKDMPAQKAGLKEGDIVTSIDGKAVKSIQEIAKLFAESGAGKEVKIGYTRGEKKDEVKLTLAARPGGDEEEGEGDEGDEGGEYD